MPSPAGGAGSTATSAEFRHRLIAALGVLGLGLIGRHLFPGPLRLSPLTSIRRPRRHPLRQAEKLEGELPYEIEPLQQELNALIRSNQEIVDRARTQVGNLAHASRRRSASSPTRRGRMRARCAKVVEQAEVMRTQITHYLDRARVAARSSVIGDITNVDDVLQGLMRALERIHEDAGSISKWTRAPALKFQGEKQDLEEMVGNLLDNACKWASSQVKASARPAEGKRRFAVIIDDDGPGLTEDAARESGEAGAEARRDQARLGARALDRRRSRPSL